MTRASRVWCTPDTVELVEGEEVILGFDWISASPSSPTCAVYQNGTDRTTTYMPVGAGVGTASGTIVSSPTLKSLKGGEILIVVCKATVAGQVRIKKLRIVVVKPGGER